MTLGIVNVNSCVTFKLPIIKKKNSLVIIELVADKFLLYIVNKHQCNSLINYLLLLVIIIIQCIVKIRLVTENFSPNYQSLFFKLTQLA